MVAMDCTLRDDWTLVCIPIPVLATQILSKSFCVFVVIGAVIFALYGISLYYSRRPFCRILSFGCLVFGMQLCLPQVWLESLDPTYMASSNLPLYVLFAIGDVVAHVGLMMLVYWDICMEAVLLIYALAPLHQRIGYKVSTWVGAMSVASQVLVPDSVLDSDVLLADWFDPKFSCRHILRCAVLHHLRDHSCGRFRCSGSWCA